MKKMITVSLVICAFWGARAEEAGAVEPDKVYYLGSDSFPTLGDMRDKTVDALTEWYPSKPSPMGMAESWSDNELPHSGPVYVARATNGCDVLWTPFQTSSTVYDMFKTLVLTGGIKLFLFQASGQTATFNDLRIDGSAEILLANNGGSTILDGRVELMDSNTTLTFRSWNGRAFKIKSEISGNGTILLTSFSGTSTTGCSYEIPTMNSNFKGKVVVSSNDGKASQYTTVAITNEYALGGALDEFTYDALHIKNWSCLKYEGASNLVLSASSNRGILIGSTVSSDRGCVSVTDPEGVLTVNCPITLGNKRYLRKYGMGRLVLGNGLKFMNKNDVFIDNTAGTSDNKNIFYYIEVNAGTLSATHVDAINGACVAFSNDTALVMNVDVTDASIKKWGLRCDKTRYASALSTDIPIRICASDIKNITESKYRIPLLTVKDAYAEGDFAKLKVSVDIPGYRLNEITSAAADGITKATTFYADILHNGLVISVR